jgi:putative oxidoreductase
MLSVLIVFCTRCLLVALFLPFSALDKLLNFPAAVDQARQAVSSRAAAQFLIAAGFGIEVVMSAAILTGVADRLAGFILAMYCIVTAVLWKQFWRVAGFKLQGPDGDRALFWDFLKNFALAGGFLILAFGSDAAGVADFFAHPLASSHAYSTPEP